MPSELSPARSRQSPLATKTTRQLPPAPAHAPKPLTGYQRLALLLALIALGLAGNHYNLSLFFGVNIIFGSVAVWLALFWLGWRSAIIVAAISGLYTYVLWDHPYAFIIFVAEATCVGGLYQLARRRGRESPPLVWLVSLYWLLIGAPLVVIFYRHAIAMPPTQVMLIAIKQPLNGILNAALAEIILFSVALLRRQRLSLSLRQLLFSILLTAMLVPVISLMVWQNQSLRTSIEAGLRERLLWFTELARLDDEHQASSLLAELEQSLAAHLPASAQPSIQWLPEQETALVVPSKVEGLSLLMPRGGQPARMERWREAHYRVLIPVSTTTGTKQLAIEVSALQVIDQLHERILRLLSILLTLVVISAVFAERLSSVLSQPLARLIEAASRMPAQITAGRSIEPIRPTPVRELEQLAQAISLMGDHLVESFSTLQQTLERVSRSESLLQEAQAITHLGSWSLDYRSNQLTWTDETYRLLGYASQAVPASLDAFFAVVHPDDAAAVQTELAAAPERADGAYRIECRFRCADGIERRLLNQGRVSFDADGKPLTLTGTTLDVTHQRRIEADLRAQRQRYQLVIDNLEDLIIRTDAQGRLEFVSPSFCRLFCRSESELIGQDARSYGRPSDPQTRHEFTKALQQPPYMHRAEHYVSTKQGWRWLQWVDRAILDQAGEITGIVSLGRDITERKLAELDLIQREAIEAELLQLATAFVVQQDEKLAGLIDQVLEQMGSFTRSDRAYLFQFGPDEGRMSNTHEWIAPGVEPMISHLQDLPIDHFSATMQRLLVGQPVIVPRVAELDEDWAEEREILEFQGIQSVLLVPLMDAEQLTGFIGFDAVYATRDWLAAEVRFLQVVANLMVGAFARARIHQDLVQSQTRFDQVARQSRSVAWEVDVNGCYTYISPVIEDLLGYPPEALVGKRHFYELFPETQRENLKAAAFEYFLQHKPFEDFLNPICHADGRLAWVNTNGFPILDDDGALQGYRGIDIDITARYQAEQQLRDSEARLSAIFNQAPIGIATADPEARLTLANQALANLLGYERTSLIGLRLDQFTHPEDLSRELSLYAELQAGKRSDYRITKRYLRANGEIRWGDLRVVLIPQDQGQPPVPLGMVEDITDIQTETEQRKRLEQDVADYTQGLEGLVNLSSRSMGIEDELQALLALGCETLQMGLGTIGWIERERHYQVRTDYATPVNQGQPPSPGQRLLTTCQAHPGQPQQIDSEILTPSSRDAGWCSALALAIPWTAPDGRGETLMLSFWSRQCTPSLSKMHQELTRLIGQRLASLLFEEQVQQVMIVSKERETIGHLASGIAHDFNNLLGVIDANMHFLQAALNELPVQPENSEMIEEMIEVNEVIDETQSALGQAKVITSGMLSLSRASNIHLERTLLEPIIAELSAILRHILPERIQFSVRVEPDISANTSAAFLQSALLNLVLNARDAMPDGGRLQIETQHCTWDGTQPLAVGQLEPGQYIALRITDTGSGMDAETRRRLFEPLFTTKAKQRGHGLGLFMVQEFVLRSGAGLLLESTPGHGSVFELLLPTSAAAPASPSRESRADAPAAKLPRVLLVDDDPRVRESVSRLLRRLGAPFAIAEDATACLQRLAQEPDFDLVLSDLAMPTMDGVQLSIILSERHPDLRIVLMTGQDDANFGLEQLTIRPPVLRKPIVPEQLLKALQAI
ncbi:MAG: hypothetical protein C1943_17545 [Halochromatium sp.]|nr:hypothetical protein [Halochromatium sp.]